MPIKHVKTEIKGDQSTAVIWMRFADAPVAENAKASVELKVPFENLSPAEVGPLPPGTYPHTRFQIAALRYVRDALTAEIQRLSNPEDR